jgi:hypothetical protein
MVIKSKRDEKGGLYVSKLDGLKKLKRTKVE